MKQYQWRLSTAAANDLEEAVEYYNSHSFGLGNKFVADASATLKKVSRNPFSFSVKYDDVRCAALNKFPFAIHYRTNKKAKEVEVIAVFNTYKEPFW